MITTAIWVIIAIALAALVFWVSRLVFKQVGMPETPNLIVSIILALLVLLLGLRSSGVWI